MGLLVWDTSEGPWGYCPSIACPEFPDILDEDIFELLRLLSRVKGRFLAGEDNLYHWAIVLAAKRAIEGLDR